MNQKVIDLGYRPRFHQKILHNQLKRFNVIVAHRRFGKTHFVLMDKIDKALRNTLRNPQYAYVSPTFKQSKRIAWEILKDYSRKIPGWTANETELRVDIPRPHKGDFVRLNLLGGDDPGSLRGLYLDGVTLDEYGEMGPEIWGPVLRPALADRGGWATFIGTPKGMNHFYDIYQLAQKTEDWGAWMFKASETGIISKSELEAAKAVMSEDEYEQEFECSFSAALIGAYFGKQMSQAEAENRIAQVPYDKAVPVSTYWDLGIGDSTAIWFVQQVGRSYHVIDHLEDSGQPIEYYAKKIREKDYDYEEHVLPHDAAARDLGSGKTREEILRSLGLRTRILPRQSLEDGIDAVRLILNKCWFDAVKCERGINCLKNYEKRWDAKNKIFSSQPLHNWASHSADAFRVFAMGTRDGSHRLKWESLPRESDSSYNIFGG